MEGDLRDPDAIWPGGGFGLFTRHCRTGYSWGMEERKFGQKFVTISRNYTLAIDLRRIGWVLGVLLLCVLVYAWIDGGATESREIAIPVAVPEAG